MSKIPRAVGHTMPGSSWVIYFGVHLEGSGLNDDALVTVGLLAGEKSQLNCQ